MRVLRRKAIALLITVLFIMAITVSIGIGLKQIKDASSNVTSQTSLFQTSVVLDDVLTLLKTSKELEKIAKNKSAQEFFVFLSSVSFIPFEISGFKISIEINSARSKFNLNDLVDSNKSVNIDRVNVLNNYFSRYNVNSEYMNFLLDSMRGIKDDLSYSSSIFNENPDLFRDYIASKKHFEEINNIYLQIRHDNSFKNLDLLDLVYFSKDKNSIIDLNYATPKTWEMLLTCDEPRAKQLSLGGGFYDSLVDLDLNDDEKNALAKFSTGYFEPYLNVVINITKDKVNSKIKFEYDINTKKGTNFVYEI